MSLVIPSPTSVEKLRCTIITTVDPTGGAVNWQLTATGALPSGSWVAGAWIGSYSGGQATSASPLISALGAVQGGHYDVWVQWTVGSETPQRVAGQLTIGG